MTGPEHYAKAETLAANAREFYDRGAEWDLQRAAVFASMAQAHATLALAAATALRGQDGMRRGLDMNAWEGAASIWKNH